MMAFKIFVAFGVVLTFFASTSFADLNDGLLAYYPFNGNANDESGNGVDGTESGVTLTEDRFGSSNSAYTFDGIDDHIGMGFNVWSKSDLFSSSYTAWIKTITNAPNYVINIEGSIFSRVFISSTTHFSIDARGAAPNCEMDWPDDGQWHFFTATVSPAGSTHEVNCYLNSELQDTSLESFSSMIDSRNSRFVLGMVPQSDWAPQTDDGAFFDGELDEVRIYNRVLSMQEIEELFALSPPTTPLAAFTLAKADITFDGDSTAERVNVKGSFALAPSSNGIDPTNEAVDIAVGTASVTIPAGFLVDDNGTFTFDGVIDGIAVNVVLNINKFEFMIEATGVDLTDTANPVDIMLAIGDDIGMTTVRLDGKLKLKGK